MRDEKLCVRVREAASMLSVSPQHLRRFVKSGALPSFRMGAARLVRIADIHAYIEAQIGQQHGTSGTR